jgi:prevent-host-death family protein
MSLKDDIRPITYMKTKASDLISQVNETRRPVVITQNGEPKAVIQDPQSYEEMKNTIGLLKLISQGEEDIRNGRIESQDNVFSSIEKAINKK